MGCIALLTITIYQNTELKKENKYLKKENIELWEQNTDYKWQLEQVPIVVESRKDEICRGE